MIHYQYTPLTHLASMVAKPNFVKKGRAYNLPRLFVFTDPKRSPDLFELAQNLPKRSVLVYRHFQEKNSETKAHTLKKICRQQGAYLLIGADPDLALRVGADGVHLPQSMLGKLALIKAKSQFSLITCAAHSISAARQGIKAGAGAVIVSAVFLSSSKSAGNPLGVCRFRNFISHVNGPVIALGGINQTNAAKLHGSCHGLALVSGVKFSS